MRKHSGKQLLAVVLLLLAAAFIVVRTRESGFRWDLFAATFRQLDLGWLGASLLMGLATYMGRVLRWEVMMRPLTQQVNRWNIVSATAIGFTAVVLFGRAGELVRPLLVARKEKVPLSTQMAAWLLERIFDLLVVLLLFGCALVLFRPENHIVAGAGPGPGVRWLLQVGGVLAATVGAVCLLALTAMARYGQQMGERLLAALGFLPPPTLERIRGTVLAFAQGMEVARDGRTARLLVIYTVVEWALIAGCYYALFRAYPSLARFSLLDVLLFLGFVSFGSILQIPGIGGGMQIVAVVILTELFGQPVEQATSVALLMWGITFLVIVPIGLGFALREGLSWRALRQMEHAASRQEPL